MAVIQDSRKTQIVADNGKEQIDITSHVQNMNIVVHPGEIVSCCMNVIFTERCFPMDNIHIIEIIITKYGIRIVLDFDFNTLSEGYFKRQNPI